jgi:cobalamin biosynthesis Mg chelatase CobN
LPLHTRSIKCALISFLLCSTSSWATDIHCESTQQPAQRVICDHAILNHEYDDIYEQQQELIQQGKLTPNDLAAWKRKRDSCTDVHCIDGVFAQWNAIGKGVENSPTQNTTAESIPAEPVITASEALGPASAVLPASPAAAAAAPASQQASSVPVSRQGSAYGIALPQAVTSDASGAAPVSAASATTPTASGTSSNGLPIVLGVLLVAVALGVGAMVIYQRRR